MFRKLKDKLKNLFKKEVEEETQEIKEDIVEKPREIKEEQKDSAEKEKEGLSKGQEEKEEDISINKKSLNNNTQENENGGDFSINTKERKGGLFKKTIKITKEKVEKLNKDLKMVLLQNNVAFETVEKIEERLVKELEGMEIRKKELEDTLKESLKNALSDIIHDDVSFIDLVDKKVKEKKPLVLAFFGINGSGKTTSIAKIVHLLQKNKFSCVLAAADTFRAAAIHQLEEHAKKLNVRLIKHDYGADPAAVAFDAIKHAESKKIDVVLIDTAGRMHSNENLMKEMEKIVRVAKPQLKIFVAESITGNDAVVQAKKFEEIIGIDGIILTKADVDEKGGTALSISHVTKKPIFFLGTGQKYEDLKPFKKQEILNSILY